MFCLQFLYYNRIFVLTDLYRNPVVFMLGPFIFSVSSQRYFLYTLSTRTRLVDPELRYFRRQHVANFIRERAEPICMRKSGQINAQRSSFCSQTS